MTSLAIHGGAGALPRTEMTPERADAFHGSLREALQVGQDILAAGGASLDAVEATVAWLEDCPLFNAGRGSAFTREGANEMEASIMDGTNRKAGAAFLLRRVRNPVHLARRIMDHTPHMALAGEAAERFAVEQGLRLEPVEYFFTRERYEAMLRLRGTGQTALSEDVVMKLPLSDQEASGTVGAVAVDAHGNLAASTSSGGTTNKYAGRVGQAPIIGAGVYAYNRTCAVSCTGYGEAFMRIAAAHEVSALIEYRGLEVGRAAATVIERLREVDGRGGMIAVDRQGRVALPFNTEGMYRGWIGPDGRAHTAIYAEAKDWPVVSP